MSNNNRRVFLTAAAGALTGLAGCSGFIESEQVDAPEPDVTPEEETPQTVTDEATETESEPSIGSISVEKRRDLENNPRNMWAVINNSSQTVWMATVDRLAPSDDEDIGLISEPYYTFAMSPGELREFQSQGDSNTGLIESATWFEEQHEPSDEEADVTSTPEPINKLQNPSAPSPEPASITYQIPNPTDIPIEDVQEATIGAKALEKNEDGFVFSTPEPVWRSVHEVTVDSTTASETFTWTAEPAPQIELDVDGTVDVEDTQGGLTITVTAQSEMPVLNAILYIRAKGPNVESTVGPAAYSTTYVEQARVGDDPMTTALVTDTLGEERVGSSRTINVSHNVRADFPVSEDDRLIVGVASAQSFVGHPVSHTEIPFADVVE